MHRDLDIQIESVTFMEEYFVLLPFGIYFLSLDMQVLPSLDVPFSMFLVLINHISHS